MVGATDHVKHVTVDQSSQVKKLQTSLKKVEVVVWVVMEAKPSIERSFNKTVIVRDEAATRAIAVDAKVRVLSAEKMVQANTELCLGGREKVARG